MYPNEYEDETKAVSSYGASDELARDLGEVPQRMNETEELLGELSANIDQLTKLLSPVLHQQDTKDSGVNSVPTPPLRSPLAQKIEKTNDKIRGQINRIYALRNRVAL